MPHPGNQRAWASNDDYTFLSLAVIVFGLALGGRMLWQAEHPAISDAAMRFAHWQMQIIHRFTDRYELADAQVQAANPAYVTFQQLAGLYRDVGRFYRIPAALLVAALGVWCFLRAAPARFCRALDLDGLIREQAKSFPSIGAHVRRPLGLAPIRDGAPRPADAALNAREWIERWATGRDGRFDERRARQALGRQLGPLWQGLSGAAPAVRVMLAVFALQLAQRREEARQLLGNVATSLPPTDRESRTGPEHPLAFPAHAVGAADLVLRERKLALPVLAIAERHGFTVPALMSVLAEARRAGGVLAPGQFAFLKLVDRNLWYALHSLGFPADGETKITHPNPRIEAVGARDHWAAELAAARPLFVPALDQALRAVRAAAGDRLDPSKN